jgi:lipid-A-disaccharide synthase-like uncharacterized protein
MLWSNKLLNAIKLSKYFNRKIVAIFIYNIRFMVQYLYEYKNLRKISKAEKMWNLKIRKKQ